MFGYPEGRTAIWARSLLEKRLIQMHGIGCDASCRIVDYMREPLRVGPFTKSELSQEWIIPWERIFTFFFRFSESFLWALWSFDLCWNLQYLFSNLVVPKWKKTVSAWGPFNKRRQLFQLLNFGISCSRSARLIKITHYGKLLGYRISFYFHLLFATIIPNSMPCVAVSWSNGRRQREIAAVGLRTLWKAMIPIALLEQTCKQSWDN